MMKNKNEMLKTLVIMDYQNHKVDTGVDITNLDNILNITIEIVTGDEIATVVFADGHIEKFDSCPCNRWLDFLDHEYILYSKEYDINLIPDWVNRKTSYDI